MFDNNFCVFHQSHYFYRLWLELELDCLICPGFPIPAVGHEYPGQLSPAVLSTGLFNLLDFPAGSLPVMFLCSCFCGRSNRFAEGTKSSKVFRPLRGKVQ